MSEYFLKDNYTQIANDLLDALCRMRINGEARQLFDVILRKTFGYHKLKDAISTSQILKATGLSSRAIEKARRKLKALNMISTDQKVGTCVIYQIQSNYRAWVVPTKRSGPPKRSLATDQMGGNVPTKKRDTKHNKENVQKINGSLALQAVFERVFNEGLNIYQLWGAFKKESKTSEKIPESVLICVCEQYLKDKGTIGNEWGWFLHVLKLESDKYFAHKNIQEHAEIKKESAQSVGEIMRGCLATSNTY